VARDGYCRLARAGLGPCGGPSEWAHVLEHKRFKTRGMAAGERHVPWGSLMACRAHHQRLDGKAAPFIREKALTPHGADGAMEFASNGHVYREGR
jgi:hypothetical protein